jgi:hypothetical protein
MDDGHETLEDRLTRRFEAQGLLGKRRSQCRALAVAAVECGIDDSNIGAVEKECALRSPAYNRNGAFIRSVFDGTALANWNPF